MAVKLHSGVARKGGGGANICPGHRYTRIINYRVNENSQTHKQIQGGWGGGGVVVNLFI